MSESPVCGPVSKRQFYRDFYRGKFGNKGLMWNSVGAFLASGYRGKVAIRTLGVGTRCDYDIPASELESRYREFLAAGWTERQLNISAMMPDDKIILQGEVCRGVRGLEVLYSTIQKPMRQSLAEGKSVVRGVLATQLLRCAMDCESYEWVNCLLDTYSIDSAMSSVVEFSVYSACVGDIPHRNTIIWEVRNY